MTEQEFAERHGLTLSEVLQEGVVAAIVRLYVILTSLVSKVREANEGASVSVKLAVETVEKDENATSVLATLAEHLRETIFETLQEFPNVSVLLPDVLSEISSEVRDMRKLVMAGLEVSPTENVNAIDTSALRAEAEIAKATLERFVAALLPMEGKTLSDLPADMVKSKDGKLSLSLPRLPNRESDDDSADSGKGRDAKVYQMTFAIDGEPVPDRIGFDRLAVWYCSTTTSRINGSELKEQIKRQTGKDWHDHKTFSVKVPAGTLSATLVEAK